MSFLAQRPLTRRRYNPGAYDATGMWTSGATTDTTFSGSLQPLNGRDREVLPEGLRRTASKKVYAPPGTLRTVDQHANLSADEVVADGLTYVVIHVDESRNLLPHQRVFLQRKREEAP